MNHPLRWRAAALLAALATLLAGAPAARAQQTPHVGYAFPAGGKQGTSFEITVGGQYLGGVNEVLVSGQGVQAKVIKYTKPISRKQLNDLSKKLKEMRDQGKPAGRKAGKAQPTRAQFAKAAEEFELFAKKLGLENLDLKTFAELRKKLSDPKRQPNPQIEETVTLHVTVAPEAAPGDRELRLRTSLGLTNPLVLRVGQYPECFEKEPNDEAGDAIEELLPVVLNGQIAPGDVDRFRFRATKGSRLVAAVGARALIPYLADAVPGWFQATLALYDAKGNEVAYVDDWRFDPDPVLCFEVPEDGEYVLEIHDAIYRGREDFVYRITLGEVPFVTGLFPLGGPAGAKTAVQVAGWNLPADSLTLDAAGKGPGVMPVSVTKDVWVSNRVPFALDALPECLEAEPDDERQKAQRVELPVIVNGRIDRPGDWDVFRFDGRAGQEIVAEVNARTLGSPLDSLLTLTDEAGKPLAANDDHPDKAAGLVTHQADSLLRVTLPKDGAYLLRLGDTQNKGGPAYAYRLRISPPRPDFELRVVPSSLSARTGMAVPVTVYALRKDGFAGEIELALKDAPRGFELSGGRIPAGQDAVRLTLSAPTMPRKEPLRLRMEGRATLDGREARRQAVPAEDMMQAFLYRHLVPADEWLVFVGGRGRYGPTLTLTEKATVKLPAGGTARVRVAGPSGPFMQQVKFELSDPPEGIAIRSVKPDPAGLVILLAADGEKAKSGLTGNLLVSAFTERVFQSKSSKAKTNKRRFSLGMLPAIPFEIVPAAPATAARP